MTTDKYDYNDIDGLLQSAPDAILVITLEGIIRYYNRAFIDIVAWDHEEDFTGRKLQEMEPDFVQPVIENGIRTVSEKGSFEKIYGRVHRDGNYRVIHTKARLIGDIDPPVILAVIREFTELAKAEEELKQYRDRLEELVRERTAELQGTNLQLQQEVAERMRAEEALHEREDLVSALLNATTDGALLMELDSTIVAMNEKAAAALNGEPAELIGMRAVDLFSPEVAERRRAQAQEVIRTAEPHRYVDQRDGMWFDTSVYPVCNERGEVVRLAVFIRDITEQRRVNEALRESESKYRTLVEKSLEGIAIAKDNPIRIVFANSAMEDLLGYSAAELTSLTPEGLNGLVHEEDRSMFFSRFRDRMAGKKPVQRYEFRALRKDDRVIWLAISSSLIEYGGEPAVFATYSDISARKEAETALRTNEEKLKAQFKSIPIPTYTWKNVGEDFVLVDYNDAAEKETQGRITKVVGSRASEFFSDRPEFVAEMLECYREKAVLERRFHYRYKTVDKESDLFVRAAYVPPDQIMVHTEDVTEKVRIEKELNRHRKHLKELVDERTIELERVNAQLRQEISERVKVEKALERHNRELEILNEINRYINMSGEAAEILQTMLKVIIDFCGASVAAVYEVSHDTQELALIASLGVPDGIVKEIERICIESKFIKPIVDSTGVTVVGEDIPELGASREGDPLKSLGVEKTIAFPIRSKDRTNYLTLLGIRSGSPVDPALRHFLEIVTSQLGIAVERVEMLKFLEKRKTDLKKLAGGLLDSIEEERRQIALSLHDDMGQSLAALKYDINRLEKKLPWDDVSCKKVLERINEQLRDITESIRQNSYSLHPAMLEDLGLIPTLRWYIDSFIRSDSLEVDFEAVGFDERVPEQIRLTMYRVAQEALTNVVRHAEAGRISLKLTKGYPKVIMVIEDDGKGFSLEKDDATGMGLGIVGIRERVEKLGGGFNIRTFPGKGTRIRVTLPLEVNDED
jgi:PAS domain S-box-containing protein